MDKIKLSATLRRWLPVLAWMLIIFTASTDAMSSEHTARLIVPILRWLKSDISQDAINRVHFLIRKCGHLTEYAILAILLWRALPHSLRMFRGRYWREALVVLLIATSYAAADEFHQSFVPSRGPSAHDVMIDGFGAMLGLLIHFAITRRCAIKTDS